MFANLIKSENKDDVVKQLLVFVLSILVSTFILRIVWNTSLVKHLSFVKPIKTLLDAFILSLTVQVVRGI